MRSVISAAFLAVLLITSGCIAQQQASDQNLSKETTAPNVSKIVAENKSQIYVPKIQDSDLSVEEKILGPSGCSGMENCNAYCLNSAKSTFDCKAWCSENKQTCTKLGIKIDVPSGIPGSPCTSDSACIQGLACIEYECMAPSPDNLAKKSSFSLPGGCTSMSSCGKYCAEPGNSETCKSFCEKLPSFCSDFSKIKASTAPEECKECVKCEQTSNPKDCILDCTYKCFAYMPFEKQNATDLKSGVLFARNYQEPIKAVWEPGPANNRNGIMYFTDYYKEIGVNTYSISPKYNHKYGKLTHVADYVIGEGAADNEKIANIIRAKKAGFQIVLVAHDLYDMFPDVSGKDPTLKPEDYYDDIERTALKWAKVAEDYKVEYFAPVNEFEYMLYENGYSAGDACKITNGLYQQLIPKVKEIYKGKIYCRVGGMDGKFSCMDFSQCDIFGFTYGFSGGDARTNFDTGFAVAEEVATRDGKPYVMAEAFSFNSAGYQVCTDLHLAGIDSYKKNAKSGKGYTFMGVVQRDPIKKNDCPIIHPQVKDALVPAYKNFFTWMDTNN